MTLCRWSIHRWTRWASCLIERDQNWSLVIIKDVQWRMCRRCGHQEERDLSCVSS